MNNNISSKIIYLKSERLKFVIFLIYFHFKDIAVAEAAETSTLRKNYKAILRNGQIIVLLWDDGVTAACSNRIMHLVLSALEIKFYGKNNTDV